MSQSVRSASRPQTSISNGNARCSFTGKRIKLSFYELPLRSTKWDWLEEKVEEGDITAQTFEPLMTTGATQTESQKSRSGFLWSGPPETVGVKKLSDVHCLRASCATREEKRGAERKKRLAGKLETVNVACQQHGSLAYAINSCVKSDDRPSVGFHCSLLRYITSLSSVQCTQYYTHATLHYLVMSSS